MKFKLNLNKYSIKDKNYEKQDQPESEDDYVAKSMGAFGRWQAVTCVVVSLSRVIAMWNVFSSLFLTPATKFICIGLDDAEDSKCYRNCTKYEFSEEVFNRTLISDFNLICDKAWMASFTQTGLMFGVVVGVAVFGWISDRFGRSKAIILSAIMNVIFMIGEAFAPNYGIFIALRFFIGVASGGIMSITAVYTLEIVGSEYRELAGTVARAPDAIAETSLAGFAYLATTWNVYLLEFGGISIVIMVLLLFLPETPRWLMANGKAFKAVELMTKAAKFNKLCTSNIRENVDKSLQAMHLKENDSQRLTYLDLFKTRTLSIVTTCSFIVWFMTGLCYFGLNQYITVLGSYYIVTVVAIIGVIQLPMSPLATVITKAYGRKAPLICTFLVVGVNMIILLCLKHFGVGTWVSLIFGMIGTCSSCVAFCILYIYVIELYPTPMRNMGFSLSSLGSKLGAMFAPFVVNIELRWVSSLIFAVTPFIAAAICLLLPETKNRKLRDTIDE